MKRLFIVILIAALGWAGYWFVGAKAAKNGFASWFSARQSEGWLAETSDISVAGFPNRFDTTFSDIALADPDTGVAWFAPFFQLLTLSYQPNHLIAIWPNSQSLAFPDQKVAITSSNMKASLVLEADASLPLERSNFSTNTVNLRSDVGWALAADSLQLALYKHADTENTYRFALNADGFAPPAAMHLPTGYALPRTFKTLQADILAGFDAPWDRRALEVSRPQPNWIDIKKAEVIWGDLELHIAGKVSVNQEGYPSGEITLRATNWREIITLAQASGQVPQTALDAISSGLELISALSGNPRTLDIPLNFKNRAIRIGPVAIAATPRLILR